MSITTALPGVEGLAPGQTATLRVPIGKTYEQIWFELTSLTAAQITQIRILANAKQIGIFSGTELNQMNAYVGRTNAAARLCIDFTRKNLRARAQEQLTGLSTGTQVTNNLAPIVTLTLQIDIASTATNPGIKATAVVEAPKAPGLIRKISRFNYNFPAIGDHIIADLPKGDAISKVFFINSNISKLIVQRDQFTEFERSKALNAAVQEDGFKRDPITGMFVFDTSEEGFGTDSLLTRYPTGINEPPGPVIGDMRFIVTTGAINQSVPVLVEYLGYLGA